MNIVSTEEYKIAEVVPQDAPMILIDEVIDASDNHLVARVKIRPDSIFLEEKSHIPGWIGIEYMAQSIAAWTGVVAKRASRPVQIGYLVACKHYMANLDCFRIGDTLVITIEKKYMESGVGLFDCKIEVEDVIAAKAVLTVYQPDQI